MNPVKSFVFVCFFSFGFFGQAAQGSPGTTIQDGTTFINGPIYVVSNNIIEKIDYPNLESVNGPIYIVSNSHLMTVNFPKLKYVNGPIYITFNSDLNSVAFPNLVFVNGPVYYYWNKE